MAIYNIKLNFDSSVNLTYQAVFQTAANRWESIITGDLPSYNGIDDIAIDVSMPAIDGIYNILGQAGPVLLRPTTNLPAKGVMQFDIADVEDMASRNILDDVILHEMGHVLGFGNLWQIDNLKSNANYIGPHALTTYQILANTPTAISIPIETDGNSGTAGVHWDEQTFGAELMTGYINNGIMPLSVMTIGALEDLGYSVDYSKADPYSIPTGLQLSNLQQLTIGSFLPSNTSTTNADTLLGTTKNDKLLGLAGHDSILGLDGNDTLNGGLGHDVLKGGNGNDVYIVDNKGDAITETSRVGSDTVNTSISYTLGLYLENLTLTGSKAINGVGNATDNRLSGNTGDNKLSGGEGNDTLNGGAGHDTLTGGAAQDVFCMTTTSDNITDFNVADDTIQLDNSVFTQLTTTGILNADYLSNTKAIDANDYLIYNKSSGALFYDSDGNGVNAAIQIATLGVNIALTHSDFFII